MTETPLQITAQCGPDQWTSGNWADAILCPFLSTMGGMFVLIVGFTVFSALAIYTRSVLLPAVVAIIMVGIMSSYIPALAGQVTLLFITAAACAFLWMFYRAVR
ncbi:hypothetical protein [Halomarina oriensis]|uniref:Uncharacterized protein n=1 Tax=Halomarina oriensis TaxID=671145 RepID=A0A6B0GNH5_9EURY|nr:hypothetical protein [Halomarina oriensis]MWG33138.1 hypothetical protein [Halomarina oriensis]